MPNYDQIFNRLLKLIGEKVELVTKRTGKRIVGKIVYTMVDSLLIEVEGKRQVVGFGDIEFLNPLT